MLKDLFARLFSGSKDPAQFFEIDVQCDQCGEKIRTHINMQNDLSIQYGDTDRDNVYFVRKQIIGRERCFNRIEVELTFDHRKRLINQTISSGRFISEEEYKQGEEDE